MFRSKAILVADVGQNQIWCANNFRIREGRFLTTGGMGTMGYSIPAAIGAKFARPDRDVIVICGDGSFQMGLNELATIAGNQLGIKIIIMKTHDSEWFVNFRTNTTAADTPQQFSTVIPTS